MITLYRSGEFSLANGATNTFDLAIITGFDIAASDVDTFYIIISTNNWNVGDGISITSEISTNASTDNWVFNDTMKSYQHVTTLKLPSGADPNRSYFDVTNASGLSATISITICIDENGDILGTSGPSQNTMALQTRSLTYATNPRGTMLLPMRSLTDASLLTSPSIPEDISSLNDYDRVTTITPRSFRNVGNVAATANTRGTLLNIPTPANTSQYISVMPLTNTVLPTFGSSYVLEFSASAKCLFKLGSLSFYYDETAITLSYLPSQMYFMVNVTSATSAAGTLTVSVFGVSASSSPGATSDRPTQATNIASLINSNPRLTCRATAIGPLVFVRSYMNLEGAALTISGVTTATVTTTVGSLTSTDTSAQLTTLITPLSLRPQSINTERTYRLWITSRDITCYLKGDEDYGNWIYQGRTMYNSTNYGYDGDLMIFSNSILTPIPFTQSIRQISLYTKKVGTSTRSYTFTRSVANFSAATEMLQFIAPIPYASVQLTKMNIHNNTRFPLIVRLGTTSVPSPISTITAVNSDDYLHISSTTTTALSPGSTIESWLANSGSLDIAPNLIMGLAQVYTITMAPNPLTTSQTGGVGVTFIFDVLV